MPPSMLFTPPSLTCAAQLKPHMTPALDRPWCVARARLPHGAHRARGRASWIYESRNSCDYLQQEMLWTLALGTTKAANFDFSLQAVWNIWNATLLRDARSPPTQAVLQATCRWRTLDIFARAGLRQEKRLIAPRQRSRMSFLQPFA